MERLDRMQAARALAREWAQVNEEHVRFNRTPGNPWTVQYAGRLAGLQTAARVLGIEAEFDDCTRGILAASAPEVAPR